MIPAEIIAATEALHQGELGHPIQFGTGQRIVDQPVQGPFPQGVHLSVAAAGGGHLGVILALDLDRRQPASIHQFQRCLAGWITADEPDGTQWIGQQRWTKRTGIDRRGDRGRRPQFEQGGRLGPVGVPGDHMQPAPTAGVGMRLVPGVHQRTPHRGLQAGDGLEEVGALGQLESGSITGLAEADPSCAGEHQPGHQERQHALHDPIPRRRPVEQIVLVVAVRGTLAVGVVLEHPHRRPQPLAGRDGSPRDDRVTGQVGQQRGAWRGHLRRGVLRVRVVDVEPGAVAEEPVVGVLDRDRVIGIHPRERCGAGIRVDHGRGEHRRMQVRTPRREDAVLGLGSQQRHVLIVGLVP